MLLLAAAVDGDFGVDSVAQHPLFAGREGGQPRITEIGRTTRRGLLVKRQYARRQPGFAVIRKSDCCQGMMLIGRRLIEVDALRWQLAIEDRQHEALPRRHGDLVGQGEDGLGHAFCRLSSLDLRRGARRWSWCRHGFCGRAGHSGRLLQPSRGTGCCVPGSELTLDAARVRFR